MPMTIAYTGGMKQWHDHLLRTDAMIFLLGVVLFAEGAFLISSTVIPSSMLYSLILPSVLAQDANRDRQTNSAPTLAVNPVLEQAAQLKANDMAQKSYFSHTSPAGVTPWYWLDRVGYRYQSAGENLAVDFLDASDVHTAWMNSPGHRANILNGVFTEIGIATARGMYHGNETTFVVEFFGKPLVPAVAKVNVATPPLPVTPVRKTIIPKPQPILFTSVISEPRKTTNYTLLLIGGIVLLALALVTFVRMELPHPRLAIVPLLLLVVILGIVLFNQHLDLGLALI